MNTQSIRDELQSFVYENFDERDSEILEKLSEIFIESYKTTDENTTSTGGFLNLDTILRLFERENDTKHRSRSFELIVNNISPAVIESTTAGKPGRGNKSQIIFASFDGFIQACLCLRGPKARQISRFAAKCTCMVVRLHIALQADLRKSRAELTAEREEIERRCFLVIKNAVKEWRASNGYPFTDCRWRLVNFTRCVKALLGSVYLKGATPYVAKEYTETAVKAIKSLYELDQRNPDLANRYPPLSQPTLETHFAQ